MTVLDQIVERTRARLRDEPMDIEDIRRAARDAAAAKTPFAFRAAISRDAVNVIAEIKSASPSAGTIVEDPDVESIAREYASGGAALYVAGLAPSIRDGVMLAAEAIVSGNALGKMGELVRETNQ